MEEERKINICEGVPLNAAGATNLYLNTRTIKQNPRNGPIIHLKTEKSSDVGVHINTTVSIASSKKIKLLFLLNFILTVIFMVLCCSIAIYYWNEMISMRRQLETIKDQFVFQNKRLEPSPLATEKLAQFKGIDYEESVESKPKANASRRFFVEDPEEDLDSSRRTASLVKNPVYDFTTLTKEPLVAHFNGAIRETNLGKETIIGPWVRDTTISSKNSATKIELISDHVMVQEDGLYLVYAQIVYVSHAPSCYFIWARQQPDAPPRLLSACSTGDDSSSRSTDKSQISCSVQTVARLYRGDTVNMAQREPNRVLWLRPGYSYFGFVKLSS